MFWWQHINPIFLWFIFTFVYMYIDIMVSNSNYNVQILRYQIMISASLISNNMIHFRNGIKLVIIRRFSIITVFAVIFSFIKYRWFQKLMHLILLYFFCWVGRTNAYTQEKNTEAKQKNKNKKSDSYLLFTILCVN